MITPHREYCLIDNRVSSPKQAAGTSLENQKAQATYFAKQRSWQIARVFSKVYSGADEHREDFEEILQFIRDRQKTSEPIHHYIVTCIDRFTRVGVASYEKMKNRLTDLGVQLHDVYGVIQPVQNSLADLGFEYEWSKSSPTESAQLMAAQEGKQERARILNRTIRSEIVLTQQGYHIGPPNDGFLNAKTLDDGRERPIQIPHPERAKFFEALFELSARGTLTDKEIVQKINAMGYRSKDTNQWSRGYDKRIIGVRKGTPMTVKRLQLIRQRTDYAGVKCCTWTHFKPVKTRYSGLVPIDTFNQANRGKVFIEKRSDGTLGILYNNQIGERQAPKRQKHRPLFAYDKCLLCPKCQRPTLSSASTGKAGTRYPYYHCNRGHYWGVPQQKFEATVDKCLDQLAARPQFIPALESVLLDCYDTRKEQITKTTLDVTRHVAELEAQQATAYADHRATASAVVKRKLEEEIEDLERKINFAKQWTHRELDIKKPDIVYFLEDVAKILEHPKKILKNNTNPRIQQAFWELVFEAKPTYDEILSRTPKLAPIFALSDAFNNNKSVSAAVQGFEWNTWVKIIKQWNGTFQRHEQCLKRPIAHNLSAE